MFTVKEFTITFLDFSLKEIDFTLALGPVFSTESRIILSIFSNRSFKSDIFQKRKIPI